MSSQRDNDQFEQEAAAVAGLVLVAIVAAIVAAAVVIGKTVAHVMQVYATHGQPGQAGFAQLRRARNALFFLWVMAGLALVPSVIQPDMTTGFYIGGAVLIGSTLAFLSYVERQALLLGPAAPAPMAQPVGDVDSYLEPFAPTAEPTPAPLPAVAMPVYANGQSPLHSPA